MASVPIIANDDADALYDGELELSLIGLLLTDNSHIDRVADILKPEDFADAASRQAYEAAVLFASQGKAANPATLKGHVDNVGMLFALTANPPVWLNPVDAAKKLADLSCRRRMREGLLEAAALCSELSAPTNEIVTLADAAVTPQAQGGIREASISGAIMSFMDTLDEYRRGVRCQSIPTLDEALGPLEASQLVIMAGRPGMGKTATALSYALGAAQAGHGVLFVSLEMNQDQLVGRMLADLCFDGAEIPYAAIRDRQLSDFQRRRLYDVESKSRGLPLRMIDAGSLTPSRLGMIARRTDRRFKANGHSLDLIMVDYLQLMRADNGSTRPYEAVSEISRGLKALAKDCSVPVLALAQLSREVERRAGCRPQLADLRDSGQIEQDADSVVFLLRDEYYLRKEEPPQLDPDRPKWDQAMAEARGKIEFIVAKRRNGVEGCAFGTFHGAYQAVR